MRAVGTCISGFKHGVILDNCHRPFQDGICVSVHGTKSEKNIAREIHLFRGCIHVIGKS